MAPGRPFRIRVEGDLRRDLVLEWLCKTPCPDLDEVARRLGEISPPSPASQESVEHAAKLYVKQLYRSLYDQGLLVANDYASLARYAQSGGQRPPLARELRPKNAYNLLRLIEVAAGWLRNGEPDFVVRGALRERLLEIKGGRVPLEQVLAVAERMVPVLESARDQSALPNRPDYRRADELVRRIGEELARRFVEQAPGPLGRDAAAPPRVEDSS